jgi:vanillate O-demethylase ferredoxin subunit
MSELALLIARREEQGQGVVVLDLVSPDGSALPPFEAGAHVDLQLGPGLVRQYSLCGDPADRSRYRLGILREPASRGGSDAVFQRLHPGELVRLSLPRNLFPLTAGAAHSVLLGGGIGITPLLAMAQHLHATAQRFDLHYCVRSRAHAAFLAELEAAPFPVQLHTDDGPAEQRLQPGRDLPPPERGTHLYLCGPAGFMDWLTAAARERGYPEAQIHREYFKSEIDSAGDAFEIVLARSGRLVVVPGGTSIVEALAGIGVRVEVSCEQGVCGTCLTDVLEGVPDHRDSFLTDEERASNQIMTLCCSRAKSPRLTLDL